MVFIDQKKRIFETLNKQFENRKFSCRLCKHYNEISCAAFPVVIPVDILTGKIAHTGRHPSQDNDTVFEDKEDKTVK